MAASTVDTAPQARVASHELIGVSVDEGVMRLHLNRPTKKNALTGDMYLALSTALLRASDDASIRAVVISAEGPDFCSGNDVLDFAQNNLGTSGDNIENTPVILFLKALCYFDKPLIAAVQGQAVGVGSTLLLHCDLVIGATDVRLSVPFLKLGLTPEGASSQLLAPIMGHRKAFEWLALGEAMTADEALSCGLFNHVVTSEKVLETALSYAHKLCQLSPGAVMHTKRLMRDPESLWLTVRREAHVFYEQLSTPEAAAAFQAFLSRAR